MTAKRTNNRVAPAFTAPAYSLRNYSFRRANCYLLKRSFLFLAVSFITISTAAQRKKVVLGTFEIGCKVFNYNFSKNANGLYSFRIEYAETETLLYVATKDSLKTVKDYLPKPVNAAIASLGPGDSLTGKGLQAVQAGLTAFIDQAINDSTTIDYIYARKDSLKTLMANAKKLGVTEQWIPLSNVYHIDSMFSKIEAVVASAIA